MDDTDKREAELLARLEAEREQRLAEKVEAGEIVSVALSVVVGTESQLAAAVEQAKTNKLAELRGAGETREIVFDVTMVVTGVCRPGENAEAPAWKPMSPPYLPRSSSPEANEEEAVREDVAFLEGAEPERFAVLAASAQQRRTHHPHRIAGRLRLEEARGRRTIAFLRGNAVRNVHAKSMK